MSRAPILPTAAAAAAAVFLGLAAAAAAAEPPAEVRFMAMGDWGGQTPAPYTTPGELQVARQMGLLAEREATQFVLALGDNFYHDGVKNSSDPRFAETFENVFTADSLQVPFYVQMGNHDYHAGLAGLEAQIEYTQKSSRWRFPSHFYTFTRQARGFTVQFLMIDTVTLDVFDPVQLKWIGKTLANSTADWIVVGGHYPVYSAAEHGPTGSLVKYLLPLLEKHGVAVYTCGHDHDMAHYRVPGVGVDFMHTGAAHSLEYSLEHLGDIPGGRDSMRYFYPPQNNADGAEGAFASVRINATHLTGTYVSGVGRTLYSFTKENPRASRR